MDIFSPVKGELKSLEEVNDEVFSLKMMGEGVAIVPEDTKVVSPINGVVTAIFPTGHAIGLKTNEGVEILLHLGIDTVELEGDYFNKNVTLNQEIKVGELLVDMDYQGIKDVGYETDIMVIITNGNGKTIEQLSTMGKVTTKNVIIKIK